MISFMTLDVVQLVPFNCVYESSFDHFDALLLEVCASFPPSRAPVPPPSRRPALPLPLSPLPFRRA